MPETYPLSSLVVCSHGERRIQLRLLLCRAELSRQDRDDVTILLPVPITGRSEMVAAEGKFCGMGFRLMYVLDQCDHLYYEPNLK